MIKQSDSLEFLRTIPDYHNDIIYADPPYGLGSEIIIKSDGKVDYAKAIDFMNKWDMPTGEYWEQWFKEAYRSLKHGGYCILFGIDRVTLMFKYYAHLAGFEEHQSLYWYFISSFPKSSDLSKNIDKHFGEKREVLGYTDNARPNRVGKDTMLSGKQTIGGEITNAQTPLAKKYDGYKYSISPLKQTCETIMVFHKPYKTGSCLHDTLAMENGDRECACGALNIDGGRVPICNGENNPTGSAKRVYKSNQYTEDKIYGDNVETSPLGRYPSQTFIECTCDEVIKEETITKEPDEVKVGIWKKSEGKSAGRTYEGGMEIHTNPDCPCNILDRQSGNRQSEKSNGNAKIGVSGDITPMRRGKLIGRDDKGGCSKILHKCKYEEGEYDLYMYCPKVSKKERDGGLDNFEYKNGGSRNASGRVIGGSRSMKGDAYFEIKMKNNHPALKPISLNERILKLFKTPNHQKICYPFAGVASEIIGGIRAGFNDWTACEINEEYIKIGEARIDYWTNRKSDNKNQEVKSSPKTDSESDQISLF